MRSKLLSVASLIGLLVAFFVPAQPALSSGAVTKTITVTGIDGDPYQDAWVSLVSWVHTEQGSKVKTGHQVKTNASGVAVLSVDEAPTDGVYLAIVVQPADGDLTSAVQEINGDLLTREDQAFSVQFETATTVVEITLPSGSPTPTGVPSITFDSYDSNYPLSKTFRAAKPGPLPIALPSDLQQDLEYPVTVTSSLDHDFFSNNGYALVKTASGITFTDWQNPITKSGDVWQLQLREPNIFGTLSPAPDAYSTVSFYYQNDMGERAPQAPIDLVSGTFKGQIDYRGAGAYHSYFFVTGLNGTSQSFKGPIVYVDEFGDYSLTSDGTFVAPGQFDLSVTMPDTTPNFVVETGIDVYIDLYANNWSNWLGPNWAPTGKAAWTLPDGDYVLRITSANPINGHLIYNVSVSSGVASVTLNGASVTADPNDSSRFLLPSREPNFFLKGISPSSRSIVPDVQAAIYGWDSGQEVSQGISFMGVTGIVIDNPGTYTLRADPVDSPTFFRKEFKLVATDDGFGGLDFLVSSNDTGQPVTPDANGVFPLELGENDFSITVNRPDGSTFVPDYENNVRLNGELQKYSGGRWNQVSWLNESGNVIRGGVTEAGTYRVRINALNDPTTAQIYSPSFVYDGTPTPGQDIFQAEVNLNEPNVVFRSLFGGAVEGGANIRVELENSNDFLNNIETGNFDGLVGYKFEESGTYTLTLRPGWESTSGAVETSYTAIVVVTGETATLTIDGVDTSGAVIDLPMSKSDLVIQPQRPDGTPTRGSANIIERLSGNERFIKNAWTDSDGLISLAVDPGTYYLDLQPDWDESGLVKRRYNLEVELVGGEKQITISTLSAPDVALPLATGKTYYALSLGEPNITGRVVDPNGNPLGTVWQEDKNVDVELQVMKGGYWDWIAFTQADQDGNFGFEVETPGTYRLRISPYGYAGVSTTEVELADLVMTTTSIANGVALGDVAVRAPAIQVQVMFGNDEAGYAGLELRQGDNWIGWYGTGWNGVGGIAVENAGVYELVVHPPYQMRSFASRKSYVMRVDDAGVGSIDGVTPNGDGIYVLGLSVPSVSGRVVDSSGTFGIRDAQVIPVDTGSGQEMWQYSTNSDEQGNWSMALPEGTYSLYARAPWGNVEFGDGPLSEVVTVDSNGVASMEGDGDPSYLDLPLSQPVFSGIVKNPLNDDVISNAQICFAPDMGSWSCSTANFDGEWALSVPADFAGFDDYSELMISEYGSRQFAERRISGAELESLLTDGAGYTVGETYSGIVLSPAVPNLEITVEAGDGPAQRVWVSVDKNDYGWLGSGETDLDGVAKLYLPDDILQSDFNIQVSVENSLNLSGGYSSTRVSVPASGSTDSPRTETVTLQAPNFRGAVFTPEESPEALQHAWVELFNEDTGQWIGGSGTNWLGEFSFTVPTPASGSTNFSIRVNPPWNKSVDFSTKQYNLTIDSSGAIEVIDPAPEPDVEILPDGVYYDLFLANPSVSGVVVDSSGATVRDSWVVPMDNSIQSFPEYAWQYGTNSREGGNFSMALPDGDYLLEANPPWNTSNESRSARCAIEINGGAVAKTVDAESNVTTPSCWNNDSDRLELQLRAPNLTFNLVDESGNPVRFANVGVGYGAWFTWTQSDRNGKVSLYIDAEEIDTLNPDKADGTLVYPSMWFDPPYGNSDLVRWDCQFGQVGEPVCEDLDPVTIGDTNEEYIPSSSPKSLGDIVFKTPNTKLKVVDPDGLGVGAGAWVNLMEDLGDGTCTGPRSWLGGANTSSDSLAAFNIEEDAQDAYLSKTYCVEVNGPWQDRQNFAPKTYVRAGYAALTAGEFELGSPNLKITLVQAGDNTKAAKWSWISVDNVTASNGDLDLNLYNWVTGSGTDGVGKAALLLENPTSAPRYFRLTAHPGNQSMGQRVSCIVQVVSNVVSLVDGNCADGTAVTDKAMTLTLSSGNVSGTVSYNTNPVAGAIVVATSTGGQKVTTTTNAQGQYKLQLDEGDTWSLKVFTVFREGSTQQRYGVYEGAAFTPTSNTVEHVNLSAYSG